VLVGEVPRDDAPLYALEGRFTSTADKAHILSLPEIEREGVLAERASHVVRREQDLQLKRALADGRERNGYHKKLKTEAAVEDDAHRMIEAQRFTVHEHLVCAKSKFFATACSKLWAEGKERVIRFPQVKVDAFQSYVVWVYTGNLVVNAPAKDPKEAGRDGIRATIDLYLLGNVLDSFQLRNDTMKSLVTNIPVWNAVPSLDIISRIWASTPPRSLLRQVIVDTIVMRVNRGRLDHLVTSNHPKDFLHSLALRQTSTVPVETFVTGVSKYLEPDASNTAEKSK